MPVSTALAPHPLLSQAKICTSPSPTRLENAYSKWQHQRVSSSGWLRMGLGSAQPGFQDRVLPFPTANPLGKQPPRSQSIHPPLPCCSSSNERKKSLFFLLNILPSPFLGISVRLGLHLQHKRGGQGGELLQGCLVAKAGALLSLTHIKPSTNKPAPPKPPPTPLLWCKLRATCHGKEMKHQHRGHHLPVPTNR